MLIEAVLLQLNSRLVRVQHAAAALLQLILRYGYDAAAVLFSKSKNSCYYTLKDT